MKYFVFKTNSLISQNTYFLKIKSHAFTLVLYKKKKHRFPQSVLFLATVLAFIKPMGQTTG